MEINEKPSLNAAMAAELMIGFQFGIFLANKMAEENQVTSRKLAEENQVTTKNPKKAEVDKRLAEYNGRKREELKAQKREVLTSSMCYGIGAILAVGVIGGHGYYLYQAKKGEVLPQQPSHPQQNNPPKQPPKANKFEME